MPLAPLRRTFAAAVCLLLALYAWDAADASQPPDSSSAADTIDAVAEAQALIDTGRFMEAVNILGPLVAGDTIEANTLFLYGLAATGASQQAGVPDGTREALLDQAIASFHAMLVRAPGLVRVRLELARAFFLKGEDGLAQHHFERVMAGNPPDAVAANVQRFLDEIRGRGRWGYRVGFALAPDSNIGAASGERTIYIFDLPFERDAQELTTSGIGAALWGGAEYQVPLTDDLRLRAGAEMSRREYERSQYDQFFLAGHVGPRWLVDDATEVSVLASARRRWLGTMPDHHDLGVRLEAAHRVGPTVTVSARTSLHARRYRNRTHLDGPVWDASLRGAWTVTPTVRLDLSGGMGRDRTRSLTQRSSSRWLGAGFSVALPLGFTLGGGTDVRWTDYKGNWFPFVSDGSPREDRTRSYRLSAHNRAFTLLGFSPQLAVVHETRDSNAQLHDYRRTSGELRFVQQF